MSDRYKINQPYRNPSEFKAYLDGVKATVEALRPELSVDAEAWGGGIPIDLTIYKKAEPAAAPQTALPKDAPDVYETEAKITNIGGCQNVEITQEVDAEDAAADTQ